jgi:hypothetical protein
MDRRDFLQRLTLYPGMGLPFVGVLSAYEASGSSSTLPIPEPHFPSRVYQFVWRNWELAATKRLAEVLGATESQVLGLGSEMGLPRKLEPTEDQVRRTYVTVIRQNWHLLSKEQIVQLLGWTPEHLEFTLKEDDFLAHKLGIVKPVCERLTYSRPTEIERQKARGMKKLLDRELGRTLHIPGERLCTMVKSLSTPGAALLRNPSVKPSAGEVDLSSGWTLVAPSDEVIKRAAIRFQTHLSRTMQSNVTVTTKPGIKAVVLSFASELAEGSFTLVVEDDRIEIAGADVPAILQAFYMLQDEMERREGPFLSKRKTRNKTVWSPRYLYSYFALYGDPLFENDIDPYPEGYLEKLARAGVNGVWLQAILNQLAPSPYFPEFGNGWEVRLKKLSSLVEKAADFGIKVFLYVNEPRTASDAFFERHPEVRGSKNRLCTSVPAVLDWIRGSVAHVNRHVPGLGGWFSITMSENLTNCFSDGSSWGQSAPTAAECPRCSKRSSWNVIAELIGTFREGIREGGGNAKLITWDWGWGDDLADQLIPLLPKDSLFMSISEWSLPLERGGVKTKVGEYSISVVGPGPRAKRNWATAQKNGIPTAAKVQFNNTWEISAVPYVPVAPIIMRHCAKLAESGISGLMASWTCGGYPSTNLAAAKAFYSEPRDEIPMILQNVASQYYGEHAAGLVVQAWEQFSAAYEEFPYGVSIYLIPTQHGPANALRFAPTGHRANMILFPQDDCDRWVGPYPPALVRDQFAKMAAGWKPGLELLQKALRQVSPQKKRHLEIERAIAETCCIHFQSTANQVDFYLHRSRLKEARGEQRRQILATMKNIVRSELALAGKLYPIARKYSIIGYEATNHYYYTPLDLAEKILNCHYLLDQLIPEAESGLGGS